MERLGSRAIPLVRKTLAAWQLGRFGQLPVIRGPLTKKSCRAREASPHDQELLWAGEGNGQREPGGAGESSRRQGGRTLTVWRPEH
jgi:hypothetical protein